MLKNKFFYFIMKIIFSKKFEHTVGFVLINAITGKKIYWLFSRGCPEMTIFRSKKGHFQQLISRRKKLTLTWDPHQSNIWTFYLPRIPSLGDGRMPGPENPSEVNLLYRSPKCSNIQWIVKVRKISWVSSDSPSYTVFKSYFGFCILWCQYSGSYLD